MQTVLALSFSLSLSRACVRLREVAGFVVCRQRDRNKKPTKGLFKCALNRQATRPASLLLLPKSCHMSTIWPAGSKNILPAIRPTHTPHTRTHTHKSLRLGKLVNTAKLLGNFESTRHICCAQLAYPVPRPVAISCSLTRHLKQTGT